MKDLRERGGEVAQALMVGKGTKGVGVSPYLGEVGGWVGSKGNWGLMSLDETCDP